MKIRIEYNVSRLQKRNTICIAQQARQKDFFKGNFPKSSAKPQVVMTERIFYKNYAPIIVFKCLHMRANDQTS